MERTRGLRIRLSRAVALGAGPLPAPSRGGAIGRPVAPAAEGKPPLPKTFKDYEPAFVHVDIKYLPQMPDETEHRHLIAAIDRASRWVYYGIRPDKTTAAPLPGSWNACTPRPHS